MKITIESTTKMVELNRVPARVWEGKTDSGVPVVCFITRIAVPTDRPAEEFAQFERELKEQRVPSPEVQAFDARMIL